MHQPIIPSDRLAKLVAAASAVTRQTDLTAVLRTTVDTGMELTGAAYGALGVLGEHGTLIQFVHAGLDPETAAAIGHPPQGEGLLGIITEIGKTVRIDRIGDHPDSVGFPRHHPSMEPFLCYVSHRSQWRSRIHRRRQSHETPPLFLPSRRAMASRDG